MAKSEKSPRQRKQSASNRRPRGADTAALDPAVPSVEALDLPPLTPITLNPPAADPGASLAVAVGVAPADRGGRRDPEPR